jgi:hypothetical protein
MVTPEIWKDDAVASMTRDERLLFVGMITIADDDGRLVASPAHLLGAIYPHDADVTPKLVRAWRDAVRAKNANVLLYESGGHEYIAFAKWTNVNKPTHATPSKIPGPPRALRTAS